MKRRDRVIRPCLVLAVATGLAGCDDRKIGTIQADRGVAEQLQRANTDRPKLQSKNTRNRPDTNDFSPKLRGGEAPR